MLMPAQTGDEVGQHHIAATPPDHQPDGEGARQGASA